MFGTLEVATLIFGLFAIGWLFPSLYGWDEFKKLHEEPDELLRIIMIIAIVIVLIWWLV